VSRDENDCDRHIEGRERESDLRLREGKLQDEEAKEGSGLTLPEPQVQEDRDAQ
jgi:hypothetical protein